MQSPNHAGLEARKMSCQCCYYPARIGVVLLVARHDKGAVEEVGVGYEVVWIKVLYAVV